MAKKYRLSYLFTGLAAVLLCCLISACKPPTVPTDQDMMRVYDNNYKEFTQVANLVMAEANPKFTIYRNKAVSYDGSNTPAVRDQTKSACQQLMGRVFCVAAKKSDATIQFIFFEDKNSDYFRSKSIIYDRDGFKDPRWTNSTTDLSNVRYLPLPAPVDISKKVGDDAPNQYFWRIEYRYEKHKP